MKYLTNNTYTFFHKSQFARISTMNQYYIVLMLSFLFMSKLSFTQSPRVALLVNDKSNLDANEQMIVSIASLKNVSIEAIVPQDILTGNKNLSDYTGYFCVSMTTPTGWISGIPFTQLTNELQSGKHLSFNDGGSYIPQQLGLGAGKLLTWNPAVQDAMYFIAARRPVHPAFSGMSSWQTPVNLSLLLESQKLWQVNTKGSYTFYNFIPDTLQRDVHFQFVELIVTDGVDALNINPTLCNQFGAQCTKQRALFNSGVDDSQIESNYGQQCGSCIHLLQPRMSIGSFGAAGIEYINNLFHYYASSTPIINVDRLNNVCDGDTTILDAGSGYVWYRWSTGETTQKIKITKPGKYGVMIQDSNRSCTRSDTITIASATVSISVSPQGEIIPGENVILNVRLESSQYLTEIKSGMYSLYLSYNKSLLHIDAPNATYSENGDRRVLKLETSWLGNFTQGSLAQFTAMPMLADSDHAIVRLDSVKWNDGFICTNYSNQEIDIPIKICRQGGARLISTSGKLTLSQNKPNPFNASTTIDYEIIEKGHTQLFALDMLGRRVATIVDAELNPGKYEVLYDATSLSSGIYFYVLQTPTKILFKMMQVVK